MGVRGVVACVLVVLALLAAIFDGSDDRDTVLVMTAASLADAFGEIETAFETNNPDVDIQLNLGGSASLREQILEGAPADVFASANVRTMQAVIDAGEAEAATPFARNRLQIAVPLGNPAGVVGVADLADDSLLIGLCAERVPCGDFARQALDALGIDASVDTNEGDVRALLTKIEVGELDAGIVYASDTASSDEVEAVELPGNADVDIVYPVAALSEASNESAAADFVDFVLSDDGQRILAANGFGAP